MSEESPIIKIAKIISNDDTDVIKDINICVNDTDTYFKNNTVDYDERGITPEDWEEGEIEEDADTFEWCEVLDENWASEGFCIADIEFDGDGLVLFPCSLEQLEELNGYAQTAGYSIKHAKDA